MSRGGARGVMLIVVGNGHGETSSSIRRLEDYIEKYERGLITAIRNDTDNSMDNRITITRKQKWKEQLYGRFKRLINKISREKTWKWTRLHEFKSWTRLIAFPIALIPLGKV